MICVYNLNFRFNYTISSKVRLQHIAIQVKHIHIYFWTQYVNIQTLQTTYIVNKFFPLSRGPRRGPRAPPLLFLNPCSILRTSNIEILMIPRKKRSKVCFSQRFINPMTPLGLLTGTPARLSFGDCSTLKFNRRPKIKISFDSRQRVSNGTNLVMLPCWGGG